MTQPVRQSNVTPLRSLPPRADAVPVDHSQERYTLDGAAATSAVGDAKGVVCAASPDANSVVACFSSAKKLGAAQLKAAEAGAIPPGFGTTTPKDGFRTLAAGGSALATPTTGSAVARDSYQCRSDLQTYIWNGANYTDTSGVMGVTGNTYWRNYSATYDNKVSSFWATNSYTTRWHDYANGQGAYYGNGFACRAVESLTNGTMGDGGTANDRFSSWIIY